MKTFSIDEFTYGVELEYGNCSRDSILSDGASWNSLDNTCVSSTGIANDPQGKLYKFGGEINTKPTKSIEEQVEHIKNINKSLSEQGPSPIVNYRSNLHIHIRVPGLKDDLESLKRLLRYVDTYQQQAFDIVEYIPTPDPKFISGERYQWEMKRAKRRKISHQNKVPKNRVEAMLNSTNTVDFFENHAYKDEKGRPAWFRMPRAGINLRQIFETTNTIEFRHFPGTLDSNEMYSCINWCKLFLNAALNDNDITPRDISNEYNFTFPVFQPYEFETEQVYQATNFDKNNRGTVKSNLEALRSRIDIDDINTSSLETYKTLMELVDEGIIRMSW